jgi:hypothetical protein
LEEAPAFPKPEVKAERHLELMRDVQGAIGFLQPLVQTDLGCAKADAGADANGRVQDNLQ